MIYPWPLILLNMGIMIIRGHYCNSIKYDQFMINIWISWGSSMGYSLQVEAVMPFHGIYYIYMIIYGYIRQYNMIEGGGC